MNHRQARQALRRHASPAKARVLRRFFKTGPGEYGVGDIFIGVVVPRIREVAKAFRDLPLSEVRHLVRSRIHEERLLGLLILVLQYQKGREQERHRIFHFYLRHKQFVNNWDLVDVACRDVVGAHLEKRSRTLLYRLARSGDLWDRRIAIVSTWHFIARKDYKDTLHLAQLLLHDPEDLMHKAVGWMLREVGKRDVRVLEKFLARHTPRMPRTMLRYAIERFPERQRLAYLRQRTLSR